jgi:hypothetical protein
MPDGRADGRRLVSLDVFRGLTMAAMVIVNNPGDGAHVYWPLDHAAWNGWTPTDLIFPFFLFIVGVSITLSRKSASMGSILRRGALSRFKILRPALSCDGRREIAELLSLKREDLVAGLRRLQRAACALARSHQRRRLGTVGVEVADNAGLHAQGVLQRGDRVLPTRLRVGDECLIGLTARRRRIIGRERAVDLLHVVGNALRLGE